MHEDLTRKELLTKLSEAESALRAIREGQVDAITGLNENLVVQLDSARRQEKHLESVLRVMNRVGKLVSTAEDPVELAMKACGLMTGDLSYMNVWIALADNEGRVTDVEFSGKGPEFEGLRRKLIEGAFPACFRKALQTDDMIAVKDPPSECSDCPRSKDYSGRAGYISRLYCQGRTYGVLAASVPREYAGNHREMNLFKELAGDISVGLDRIAMKRSKESEEREKARILDSISDAMITIAPDLTVSYFNRTASELLGLPREKVVGRKVGEVFPEGTDSIFDRSYHEVIRTGKPARFETFFDVPPYDNWYDVRLYPAEDGSVSIYFTVTTQKKLAELKLKASEERLALAIEGASLGTWDWNFQTGEVAFNEHWARILGYRLDELEGTVEQWRKLIHPEDLEMVMKTLNEHMEGRADRYLTEHRLRHRDGSWVWILDSGRVISRGPDGRPIRACGTHLDITESKKREARIKLLGHMLDSAPVSITVHDTGGTFFYANQATMEIHGYEDLEEFLCVNLHDLDVPESEQLLEERFRLIEDNGQASFEVAHHRKDGSTFPLHVTAKKIDWEGRNAVLSIASDISERKEAERALQESEERFRALVENSPYAILLIQDGRYIYCNPAGAALMGYEDAEDVTGRDPMEPISQEYRPIVMERMSRLSAGGTNPPMEIRFCCPDGKERWSLSTSVPIAMNGKPAVIIVGQDVTERKRMQRENRKLEERFRQFQRLESVGRLAGGVAHDLNNLLTPILGYGEMLREDASVMEEQRQRVEQILSAGQRARDLVHQLLAFSRKQTLEFSLLDLNGVLRDFSTLLRRTITEDIEIIYRLSGDGLRFSGDRGQVEQVIMNLAVNAQDAMPDGGELTINTSRAFVRGETATEPEEMEDGEYVKLEISDTGMGMDRETLEQVFEPFFTTKKMTEGTGLGLATVYGIVKQHGGYIWVNSVKGSGTVFSIFLPVAVVSEAEGDPKPPRFTPGKGSETILLVEDDDQVRELTGEILTSAGYRVVPASSGMDALALLDQSPERIDLLLTDVVMPGFNGRELYDIVKRKKPMLKVLYISGYPDDVIASRGVVYKGVNFVQKPFSAAAITSKIREVLDS